MRGTATMSGPGAASTAPVLAEPWRRSDVPKHMSREGVCAVGGCGGSIKCRRLCNRHYIRMRIYGNPLGGGSFLQSTEGVCEVIDCDRAIVAKRLCGRHYQRLTIHGDATAGEPLRIVGDDRARFMAKVDQSGDCWLWTAHVNADGYGVFRFDGQMGGAHRFAWRLLVGEVPDGMELDHLCRVRHCVNPAHMEVVTHAENVRRSARWSAA